MSKQVSCGHTRWCVFVPKYLRNFSWVKNEPREKQKEKKKKRQPSEIIYDENEMQFIFFLNQRVKFACCLRARKITLETLKMNFSWAQIVIAISCSWRQSWWCYSSISLKTERNAFSVTTCVDMHLRNSCHICLNFVLLCLLSKNSDTCMLFQSIVQNTRITACFVCHTKKVLRGIFSVILNACSRWAVLVECWAVRRKLLWLNWFQGRIFKG